MKWVSNHCWSASLCLFSSAALVKTQRRRFRQNNPEWNHQEVTKHTFTDPFQNPHTPFFTSISSRINIHTHTHSFPQKLPSHDPTLWFLFFTKLKHRKLLFASAFSKIWFITHTHTHTQRPNCSVNRVSLLRSPTGMTKYLFQDIISILPDRHSSKSQKTQQSVWLVQRWTSCTERRGVLPVNNSGVPVSWSAKQSNFDF